MQRASLMLILISALVVFGLWRVADRLEQGFPPPAADEPAPPDGERGASGPDSAGTARDRAAAGSCEQAEQRLRRVVDGSRTCREDADCTLFDYGYPIDCMTSVARSRISLLRDEYRRYDEICEHRVFFDCPTDPWVRLPVCRENRCVVELDTRDGPGAASRGGGEDGR